MDETGSEDLVGEGSEQADVQLGQVDIEVSEALGIVNFVPIDEFRR